MSPVNDRKTLATLLTSPLLCCFNNSEREAFKKKCTLKKFSSGYNILERGDTHTHVFFLLMGTTHVLNYSESGRAVTYATLSEGDMFGELAAIDGLPRSAWVCTITPCEVAYLPGADFMELVTSNPKVALAVLKKLSANLRVLDERLTDVSLLGAEQRVCIELIRMAKSDLENPGGCVVMQMPTQVNFASIVGSSRETVSRVLGRLKEDGLISQSKHGLCIPCVERLKQRAFT